jgi:TPR repeat protein
VDQEQGMKLVSRNGVLAICLVALTLAGCTKRQAVRKAYRDGDYAAVLGQAVPAAESGKADAQYYLGLMYLNGHGVAQDDRQAYMWFDLATLYANDVIGDLANTELGALGESMSPQELVQAQAMSRDWQQEHPR